MDSWCYVEPGHTDAMLNSLQQRALRPHDALLIRHEIMKPAIIELLPRHHNNGDIGMGNARHVAIFTWMGARQDDCCGSGTRIR